MKSVYVVSLARTATGAIGGSLKDVPAEMLLECVLRETVARSGLESDLICEVICGQARQGADSPNIARVAALMAGIPEFVPAYTVHRQCASGMQAILSGVQQIWSGQANVILAGGVESMSTVPFYIRNIRFGVGNGNGNAEFVDPNTENLLKSQPGSKYGVFSLAQTADDIASQYDISREEQDRFAFESLQKAVQAIDRGCFDDEIVSIALPREGGAHLMFERDEIRPGKVTLEALAQLKPVYEGGSVTNGNSAGESDGAAAVMLATEDVVRDFDIEPIARVVAGIATGVEPGNTGLGPVPAIQELLQLPGLKKSGVDGIDLFEINEAFAVQTLACIRGLGIDPQRVNVNGGAIAFGHPVGCSGTRISVSLIQEMRRRNVRRGVASLCVAGGLGMAMAFERV